MGDFWRDVTVKPTLQASVTIRRASQHDKNSNNKNRLRFNSPHFQLRNENEGNKALDLLMKDSELHLFITGDLEYVNWAKELARHLTSDRSPTINTAPANKQTNE